MASFAAFGIFEFVEHLSEGGRFAETNPYLREHPLKPLVTVGSPRWQHMLLTAG